MIIKPLNTIQRHGKNIPRRQKVIRRVRHRHQPVKNRQLSKKAKKAMELNKTIRRTIDHLFAATARNNGRPTNVVRHGRTNLKILLIPVRILKRVTFVPMSDLCLHLCNQILDKVSIRTTVVRRILHVLMNMTVNLRRVNGSILRRRICVMILRQLANDTALGRRLLIGNISMFIVKGGLRLVRLNRRRLLALTSVLQVGVKIMSAKVINSTNRRHTLHRNRLFHFLTRVMAHASTRARRVTNRERIIRMTLRGFQLNMFTTFRLRHHRGLVSFTLGTVISILHNRLGRLLNSKKTTRLVNVCIRRPTRRRINRDQCNALPIRALIVPGTLVLSNSRHILRVLESFLRVYPRKITTRRIIMQRGVTHIILRVGRQTIIRKRLTRRQRVTIDIRIISRVGGRYTTCGTRKGRTRRDSHGNHLTRPLRPTSAPLLLLKNKIGR